MRHSRTPLMIGWDATRANAKPALIIQANMLALAIAVAPLRDLFPRRQYRDKVIPTLVATWAVWIPLMAIIYSLPLALQFPMFGLALSFWVLLLTYMTNRFAGKIEADAPIALATTRL